MHDHPGAGAYALQANTFKALDQAVVRKACQQGNHQTARRANKQAF